MSWMFDMTVIVPPILLPVVLVDQSLFETSVHPIQHLKSTQNTYLIAAGSVCASPFPLLLQCSPLFKQLEQGRLLSHLMRCTRHESHARATWLRFGREGAEGAKEWSGPPEKVVNMLSVVLMTLLTMMALLLLFTGPFPLYNHGVSHDSVTEHLGRL